MICLKLLIAFCLCVCQEKTTSPLLRLLLCKRPSMYSRTCLTRLVHETSAHANIIKKMQNIERFFVLFWLSLQCDASTYLLTKNNKRDEGRRGGRAGRHSSCTLLLFLFICSPSLSCTLLSLSVNLFPLHLPPACLCSPPFIFRWKQSGAQPASVWCL